MDYIKWIQQKIAIGIAATNYYQQCNICDKLRIDRFNAAHNHCEQYGLCACDTDMNGENIIVNNDICRTLKDCKHVASARDAYKQAVHKKAGLKNKLNHLIKKHLEEINNET